MINNPVSNRKDTAWHDYQAWAKSTLPASLPARIESISRYFKGSPYEYSVDPVTDWRAPEALRSYFRLDQFDCLSFVENVLALALTPSCDRDAIIARLRSMIFSDGILSAATRHRFVDAEWLPHNRGLVSDITPQLGLPLKHTTALLDKGALLRHWFELYRRSLPHESEKHDPLYAQYYTESLALFPTQQRCAHIPLESIIAEYEGLCARWSEAIGIMTVIADTPQFPALFGSAYNITHLGFIVPTQTSLVFRHATSLEKAVLDIDLKAYAIKRAEGNENGTHRALGFGFHRLEGHSL